MSQIKKAILPVAGLGTRMLPATKAIPKEMLPIVDRPLIEYIVREAVAAGIKEIILVTHSSKNAIENHFDTSFELEATLQKRVKRQLLSDIQNICPKDVTIMHVRQGEAKGLGHAILCAQPLIGDNPFAVLLPDVLIDDEYCNPDKDNLAKMIKQYDNTGISQIMVEQIPKEDVDLYGIVDINSALPEPGFSYPISDIIEKPSVDDAPSDLAIVGRYIFSQSIWPLLEKTPIGAGDEIQLTDSVAMLMNIEPVNAFIIQGRSHDCGSKLGYIKTTVEYCLRHEDLKADFKEFLKSLNI